MWREVTGYFLKFVFIVATIGMIVYARSSLDLDESKRGAYEGRVLLATLAAGFLYAGSRKDRDRCDGDVAGKA